jgi:hypothetical protein
MDWGNQTTTVMKTSASNIILAASLGALVFKFSNAEILAAFPAGYVVAAVAAAGILALFIAEYAQERRPLKLPRRIVRPGMNRPTGTGSGAYGIRRQRAIVERVAA